MHDYVKAKLEECGKLNGGQVRSGVNFLQRLTDESWPIFLLQNRNYSPATATTVHVVVRTLGEGHTRGVPCKIEPDTECVFYFRTAWGSKKKWSKTQTHVQYPACPTLTSMTACICSSMVAHVLFWTEHLVSHKVHMKIPKPHFSRVWMRRSLALAYIARPKPNMKLCKHNSLQ